MESDRELQFEDPKLKAAVRRCWCTEVCPGELRQRVQDLLNEKSGSPRMRINWWMVAPLGLAAAVLIVAGIVHFLPGANSGNPSNPAMASAVLTASLQGQLVATHDHCCSKPDHHGLKKNVPDDDDTAIACELRAQLQRPVLVARPQQAGWSFRGASVCSVGPARSAHLVFVKAGTALSVFSLPKSAMPDAMEGQQFQATSGDHCIVGFVKDGAVFCLVGTGAPDAVGMKQLEAMSDQMRGEVTNLTENVPSTGTVALAELLQPSGR